MSKLEQEKQAYHDRNRDLRERHRRNPQPSRDRSGGRRIQVLDTDIELAIRAHSGHCMAADATKRNLPWARRVCVDLQTIRFTDSRAGLRYEYLTPRILQQAIVDFDYGHTPEPFTFVLRSPRIYPAALRQRKLSDDEKSGREVRRQRAQRVMMKEKSKHSIEKGERPVIIGGSPVPRAPGARRTFGLRGLVTRVVPDVLMPAEPK